MSGLEDTIINLITKGGPATVSALGWLLYLMERYHFSPRREKEFRDDLTAFRNNYQLLAEKVSATLGSFSTILEILKDRMGRHTQ